MKQKYFGREEFLNRIKQPECPSISVLAEELDISKHYLLNCLLIHSAIISNTTGENVCSVC